MTNPIIDSGTASIINKKGGAYCLVNFDKLGFKVGDVIDCGYLETYYDSKKLIPEINKKNFKLKVKQRFKVQDYKSFENFVESNKGKIASLDYYKNIFGYSIIDITKYHIALLEKVE